MSTIRKKVDELRKPFEKGAKYEKYWPLFDGFETFLLTPRTTTKVGAHVRDSIDLKRVMVTVILALVPALLFGMYNIGYQHFEQQVALNLIESYTFGEAFLHGLIKVLPMVVVSYGVGLGVEFLFCIIKGHEIEEGFLVSGMLIPLVMPVDLPLWMMAIAVAFAVVIGKEVFGGTGMNIWNPALLARAFAFFAYPTYMSGDKVWVSEAGASVDGMSGETILGQLKAGSELAMPVSGGMEYSVADMFFGFIPGSVGETSVFAILLGAALLLFTGIASWRIMVSGVIGAALTGLLFNAWGANALMAFDWWKHLLVGGFAFGLVFMATDPVSAAQTNKGKWIYGALIGVFSIMIRVFNPAYPEGVMLAILLMNTFAPTIDHYVIQGNIKRRLKRVSLSQA